VTAREKFCIGSNATHEKEWKTMNQKERVTYLIQYLQKEMPEYESYGVPEDEKEAFDLFRALCNVRMPGPASEEFLKVQDEYLQEETQKKGITDIQDLEPVSSDARLVLWQGDISTLKCDAIVNAANSQMLGCFRPLHGCIDNGIHTFAGVQLREECYRKMTELRARYGSSYEQPTAVPMMTKAYNLPAKYVIHVVGPIVSPYLTQTHKDQLAECYRASLDLAAENGCENIAFCCISTGVFMFPQEKAARIAVATVKQWLSDHPDSCMKKVIFNVFKDSDLEIYRKLLESASSGR
jgi:O-acetyl-ADP-ribose deacetylase (regulator of RNase III)